MFRVPKRITPGYVENERVSTTTALRKVGIDKAIGRFIGKSTPGIMTYFPPPVQQADGPYISPGCN